MLQAIVSNASRITARLSPARRYDNYAPYRTSGQTTKLELSESIAGLEMADNFTQFPPIFSNPVGDTRESQDSGEVHLGKVAEMPLRHMQAFQPKMVKGKRWLSCQYSSLISIGSGVSSEKSQRIQRRQDYNFIRGGPLKQHTLSYGKAAQ